MPLSVFAPADTVLAMFFTAIRDRGETARYIKFPREPHGFREPRHQRTRDVEEISWIQKYVRGMEWTPWERPKKDEEKKEIISLRAVGR